MLTHAAGIARGFAVGAAIALLLVTMGCGERGTPESQVRAVIAEAERAAEARVLAGLMALVSLGFLDGQGGDREELKRMADIFRGRIIDVTDKTYTIELTGDGSKLDAFIDAVDRSSILETVRTGSSGIARGERVLRV
jgi:acetolactate synthase small subunit